MTSAVKMGGIFVLENGKLDLYNIHGHASSSNFHLYNIHGHDHVPARVESEWAPPDYVRESIKKFPFQIRGDHQNIEGGSI